MELKHIQVFTDGGVFERGKYAVSVGLININNKSIMNYKKINMYKDSNYAEMFALKKTLSRLYGYMTQCDMFDGNYILEIYTDSLVCMDIIRSYMNNEPINYVYKNLANEMVELINKFDNHLAFYHVRSHVGTKHIKRYYNEFCEFNEHYIPFDSFLFIYQQNRKCDKIVKGTFKKFKKQLKILQNGK